MTEAKDLLNQAVFEIKDLRRQNQLMSARLEMFDNIMSVLHTEVASSSQGMSPDIVWEIEKFIRKEKE